MILYTVGLPGAGKTTYSNTFKGKKQWTVIDGDSYNTLEELIEYTNKITGDIFIDGLFLSKKIQDELTKGLVDTLKAVYFRPHIENCIYNDNYRGRECSSKKIIQEAQVHIPDSIYITVDTLRYDFIGKIISKNKFTIDAKSEPWTTGGTYGTCWDIEGPQKCSIEEEEPLSSFYEYVEILKFYYPNNLDDMIKEFQYVCEIKDTSEGDYYGGHQLLSFWAMDTRYLLESIHKKMYGIEDFDNVRETHPEILL